MAHDHTSGWRRLWSAAAWFGRTLARPELISCVLAVLFALTIVPGAAQAAWLSDDDISISGYLREHVLVHTQNAGSPADFGQDSKVAWCMLQNPGGACSPGTFNLDGQWDIGMARTTAFLEMDVSLPFGDLNLKARSDRHWPSNWVDDLEDANKAIRPNALSQRELLDDDEIRELYLDIELTDSIDLRLGKQQLVFGKTDFFQSLDTIHGFDNAWYFLAPQQKRRKPLWIANATIDVPDLGGSLQVYVRPSWGHDLEDIGTTGDNGLYSQGGIYQGFSIPTADPARVGGVPVFLESNVHPTNDPVEDSDYGVRFNGTAWRRLLEYSIAYIHMNQKGGVVNSSAAALNPLFPGSPIESYERDPFLTQGVVYETFYPKLDILGVSWNHYYQPWDVVWRGEFSYWEDYRFNTGTSKQGFRSVSPGAGSPLLGVAGGAAGVVEKDLVKGMINFDKSVDFATGFPFYSIRPGFFTMQFFAEWIPDHQDNISQFSFIATPRKEVETIVTAALSWGWYQDLIQPGLFVAVDGTHGGGQALATVNFIYGTNWRAQIRYQAFWEDGNIKEESLGAFDFVDNQNAIYTNITYQFNL